MIFALLLFSGLSTQAQQVTTNEDGEKVIVYPDGTWKYFNEKTEAQQADPAAPADKLETKKDRKRREKLERKRQKMLEKMEQEDQPDSPKSPRKAKGEQLDPVAEEEARQEAIARAKEASNGALNAQNELEAAAFKRASLEEEIKEANENIEYSVDDIIALEKQLEEAKAEEKVAKSDLKKAQKKSQQMNRMINMTKAKRDKMLAKMNSKEVSSPSDIASQDAEQPKKRRRQVGEETFVNPTPASDMEGNVNTKTFKARPASMDVILNPPKAPCDMAFDAIDEFSGKRRRDVASRQFFAYTSDQLRPYMKGLDYISCQGYLSSISGGYNFLYLTFKIRSENAQREFGVLEKGSPLTVRFLDGSTVKLFNAKTDIGIPDPLERSVTYRAKYNIDSSAEKILRKNEVDKVRVVWGTGYEDYEVYELDFFIEQFDCLKG